MATASHRITSPRIISTLIVVILVAALSVLLFDFSQMPWKYSLLAAEIQSFNNDDKLEAAVQNECLKLSTSKERARLLLFFTLNHDHKNIALSEAIPDFVRNLDCSSEYGAMAAIALETKLSREQEIDLIGNLVVLQDPDGKHLDSPLHRRLKELIQSK